MGNARKEQGKLEEAVEAYNKAIAIKPDFAEAWNNIFFPLEALKLKISNDQKLYSYYPDSSGSDIAKISNSILNYKLHQSGSNKEIHFDRALISVSSAKNTTIKNPTFDKSSNRRLENLPDKVVALVHFGRSGSGLLHSLIDGHPEVSTLPSIYFSDALIIQPGKK